MSPGYFTDGDTWAGRPIARKVSDAVHRGRIVVSGVIVSTTVTAAHGPHSYECTLDDGTGRIELLFVGRSIVTGVEAGARCTVEGTARMDGDRLLVWNPLYQIERVSD